MLFINPQNLNITFKNSQKLYKTETIHCLFKSLVGKNELGAERQSGGTGKHYKVENHNIGFGVSLGIVDINNNNCQDHSVA